MSADLARRAAIIQQARDRWDKACAKPGGPTETDVAAFDAAADSALGLAPSTLRQAIPAADLSDAEWVVPY